MRTARGGTDDGEPFGNAINADIEEGADDAAEKERKNVNIERDKQTMASQLSTKERSMVSQAPLGPNPYSKIKK
jgi:hypothetical protein